MVIKVKRLKVAHHLLFKGNYLNINNHYIDFQKLALNEKEVVFVIRDDDGDIQPFSMMCPSKKEAEVKNDSFNFDIKWIYSIIRGSYDQYQNEMKPSD